MAMIDVTAELRAAHIDWTRRGQALRSQFSPRVQAMKWGLYAELFDNSSASDPIWDRNKSKKAPIIFANTVALKYGKFECGLAERNRENWWHLHRRPPNSAPQIRIFPGVLLLALVFDMTAVDLGGPNPARVFESYWNECIECFLVRRRFLHPNQKGSCETRNLQQVPARADLEFELDANAARILAAAPPLRV